MLGCCQTVWSSDLFPQVSSKQRKEKRKEALLRKWLDWDVPSSSVTFLCLISPVQKVQTAVFSHLAGGKLTQPERCPDSTAAQASVFHWNHCPAPVPSWAWHENGTLAWPKPLCSWMICQFTRLRTLNLFYWKYWQGHIVLPWKQRDGAERLQRKCVLKYNRFLQRPRSSLHSRMWSWKTGPRSVPGCWSR